MNRCAGWMGRGLIGTLALVTCGAATAQDKPQAAREWRGYCQAYLQALDGDTKTSDLDVTYCLGITQGLLHGLRVGSQVGALSFGSLIAVRYQLDPDDVFKLFQTQSQQRLLGVCSPASATTADYVRGVLAHLDRNPDDLPRPIGEVFFEGLQAAYPCN